MQGTNIKFRSKHIKQNFEKKKCYRTSTKIKLQIRFLVFLTLGRYTFTYQVYNEKKLEKIKPLKKKNQNQLDRFVKLEQGTKIS